MRITHQSHYYSIIQQQLCQNGFSISLFPQIIVILPNQSKVDINCPLNNRRFIQQFIPDRPWRFSLLYRNTTYDSLLPGIICRFGLINHFSFCYWPQLIFQISGLFFGKQAFISMHTVAKPTKRITHKAQIIAKTLRKSLARRCTPNQEQ